MRISLLWPMATLHVYYASSTSYVQSINDKHDCTRVWSWMSDQILNWDLCYNVSFHDVWKSLFLNGNSPSFQIPFEVRYKLHLLLESESRDYCLYHRPDSNVVLANHAAIVDIAEHTHEESGSIMLANTPKKNWLHVLAIHPVRHTAVTRNAISKVLDVKGALEARCEETAKRCHERRKCRHDQEMELIWSIWNLRHWMT